MDQIIFFLATYLIVIAQVYALYSIFKSGKQNKLKLIVLVGISATLTWLLSNYGIKNIIAHPRPDLTLALLTPNDLYSFPSGHATFLFALFFAMYLYLGHGIKVLFVLALITGAARVLAGVHYWYDIVGAFFISGAIVSALYYLTKRVGIVR